MIRRGYAQTNPILFCEGAPAHLAPRAPRPAPLHPRHDAIVAPRSSPTRAQIRANDFNLSAGRYRPLSKTQVEHRNPRELLAELRATEMELLAEIDELDAMLAAEATA